MKLAGQQTTIDWLAVSGVQPVVYVAKAAGQPVAILEWKPGTGFRLTSCGGQLIGDFTSRHAGEAALEDWLERRA
jgi:hypothetical protein